MVAASPGIVFNDKEALTADPHTAGLLYAVWDLYPTNEVVPVFSRSEDGGRNWAPIMDDQLTLTVGAMMFDPTNAARGNGSSAPTSVPM